MNLKMELKVLPFGICIKTLKTGLLIAGFLTIFGKQSLYSQNNDHTIVGNRNYETYIGIGDSMLRANNISVALIAYRKALLIHPKDEKLIEKYLKCLYHNKCGEPARAYKQTLLIGNKYLELRRYKEAQTYFQMALKIYPFKELPRVKLAEIAEIVSHE